MSGSDLTRSALALLAPLAFLVQGAAAQCQSWSPDFGAPGASGSVLAAASWDDGSGRDLYLGGTFLSASGTSVNRIVRFDGTSWSALTSGLDNDVFAALALALPAANGLFVGGNFTHAGGVMARGIARWDGTGWSSLSGGTNLGGAVHALALFDDGSGPALYAGGNFSSIGGVAAANLARWNGSAWTALGAGIAGGVRALCVHDDGQGAALYVGGSFASAGGVLAANVARWSGGTWSALGSGTNGEVDALCSASLGGTSALFAGGAFSSAGSLNCSRIARFSAGSWSALGGGAQGGDVSALALHDDGSGPALWAGGSFSSMGTSLARGVARWDGSSWHAPASGVDNSVRAFVRHDDGSGAALYAGGFFTRAGDAVVKSIARWRSGAWGALAPQDLALDGAVRALVGRTGPGGPELFAGGLFTHAGSTAASHVARLDANGWSALGSGLSGDVWALAFFEDAAGPRLVAGGTFAFAGGVPAQNVAGWDGSAWSALGSGLNGKVSALAVFDEGAGARLFAAGSFTLSGSLGLSRIARWNGASWTPLGTGLDGPGLALCVHDDGLGPALYVGGSFASAGALGAAGLARWDGTSWSALGAGVAGTNAAVKALASFNAGAGPELYLGGSFTLAGALPARNVARWDGASFQPLANGIDSVQSGVEVGALAAHDDGSGPALYAGGYFTSADGQPAFGVARWDGGAWSALAAGVTPAAHALASVSLVPGAARDLFVGGTLSFAGAQPSDFLARWEGCAPGASSFCFGDGGGTPCPCGFDGRTGFGCPNSQSPLGAGLTASGSASVSNDGLVLHLEALPAPSSVIVYQGDALLAGGQGVVFGDGLACIGGHALRLRTLTSSAGAAELPGPADPPLSVLGQLPLAGGLVYYGAVYRDNDGFCTSSTWNSTNAVSVLWRP